MVMQRAHFDQQLPPHLLMMITNEQNTLEIRTEIGQVQSEQI